MSFINNWFKEEPAASPPSRNAVARTTSVRRSSTEGITPSQILSYLQSSDQFHQGRFKESYVFDGVVLGTGSFGCVRRCFSAHSSEKGGVRFFAAKEIKYASLKKSEVLDILSEVACLRKLNHQHIVHLKEAWLDGSRVLLIEELLEGVDGFAAVLEKGRVDEVKCKDIMWQLANAVAYCHSKRIVHRDLKLENVMLVGPDRSHVKLVDFGLATQLSHNPTSSSSDQSESDSEMGNGMGSSQYYQRSKTPLPSPLNGGGSSGSVRSTTCIDKQLTRFCGTPHYMAPEIVEREPYGRPVDVWAMGILLYILLSGETLWDDSSPKEVIQAVKRHEWSFDQSEAWDDKPKEVKDLIESMLHPDPDRRVTAFSVCCADWLHSTHNNPTAVTPSPKNSHSSVSSLAALSSMKATPLATHPSSSGGVGVSRPIDLQDGVVYSHATMKSSTFQALLSSPNESCEHQARLSLLAKREYLHLHVSQLVNFCREPVGGQGHRSFAEANSIITHLLGTAVAMARKLTNAERGSLFIVASDPSVFRGEPHLWSKVSEGGSPIRLKLGKGIAGFVAKTGDSVNVEDAYNDPRFDHTNDDTTGFKTKSVLCAPIPHGDADQSLIGVVQLINRQPDIKHSEGGIWAEAATPFSDEDEELLQDFCIHLGFGLSRFLTRICDDTTRALFSKDSLIVPLDGNEGTESKYQADSSANRSVRLGKKRSSMKKYIDSSDEEERDEEEDRFEEENKRSEMETDKFLRGLKRSREKRRAEVLRGKQQKQAAVSKRGTEEISEEGGYNPKYVPKEAVCDSRDRSGRDRNKKTSIQYDSDDEEEGDESDDDDDDDEEEEEDDDDDDDDGEEEEEEESDGEEEDGSLSRHVRSQPHKKPKLSPQEEEDEEDYVQNYKEPLFSKTVRRSSASRSARISHTPSPIGVARQLPSPSKRRPPAPTPQSKSNCVVS